MKFWPVVLLLGGICFASCEKENMMSKIPHITLTNSGPDSMRVNIDTAYMVFSFADGDADLGNDTVSSVFVKDRRFDAAGFTRYPFPDIDAGIEDPKKGLTGTGVVLLLSPPVVPRDDSFHLVMGDTTSFEMYITDRAGNQSNHVITKDIIVRP